MLWQCSDAVQHGAKEEPFLEGQHVISGWLALGDGDILQCKCSAGVQGEAESGSFLEGQHVHPADASYSAAPQQHFHLQPHNQPPHQG